MNSDFSLSPDIHLTHKAHSPASVPANAVAHNEVLKYANLQTRIPAGTKHLNRSENTSDYQNIRRRAEILSSNGDLGGFSPHEIGSLSPYQAKGLFDATAFSYTPQEPTVPLPPRYASWGPGDIRSYTDTLKGYVAYRRNEVDWFRPESCVGLEQSIDNRLKSINNLVNINKKNRKSSNSNSMAGYKGLNDLRRDLMFYDFHRNQQNADRAISSILEGTFAKIHAAKPRNGISKEEEEWAQALEGLKEVIQECEKLKFTVPSSEVERWSEKLEACNHALSMGFKSEELKTATRSVFERGMYPISKAPLQDVEDYLSFKSGKNETKKANADSQDLIEVDMKSQVVQRPPTRTTTIFNIPKIEIMTVSRRAEARTRIQSLVDNLVYTPDIVSKKQSGAKDIMQKAMTLYSDAKASHDNWIDTYRRDNNLGDLNDEGIISLVKERGKRDKSLSKEDGIRADDLRRRWGEQTHGLKDYKELVCGTYGSLIDKMQEKEREIRSYDSNGSPVTEESREIFLKQLGADKDRIHAMFSIAQESQDEDTREKVIREYQNSASNQISGAKKAFRVLTDADPSLQGIRTWEDYLTRMTQSTRTDSNHEKTSGEKTVEYDRGSGSMESKESQTPSDEIRKVLGLKSMPKSWADLFNE
ncbi:hypothetical protein I302_108302 [Kwoniella bestiolae CBS 10118]|uniref:Uncharacterized protein n=1 Tax=Kwoniella bestiolae CBS 10118 TaxID=1296100 RepID=A0A1B9FW45_9TREE|nr:hypothetical protein I302_07330 [Kwoniella bestiolae CBS 10118]OCF22980.1 hypothetical protein I302_07330 [Kwoniella bestiolae CBS 10118]